MAQKMNPYVGIKEPNCFKPETIYESLCSHHGGASVENISCRDDDPSGLQRALLRVRRFAAFRNAKNGKNGPDRDEAIDVRGAVQRVEADDVFALKRREKMYLSIIAMHLEDDHRLAQP